MDGETNQMLIVMEAQVPEEHVDQVLDYIAKFDLRVDIIKGDRLMIGVLDDPSSIRDLPIGSLQGVEKVINVTAPYKLAGKDFRPIDTIINVGETKVGSTQSPFIGITLDWREINQDSLNLISGVDAIKVDLDGYQASDMVNLQNILELIKMNNLNVICEARVSLDFHIIEHFVDMIALTMNDVRSAHYLRKIEQQAKPLLILRGISATIEEWLIAVHNLMLNGNKNIVFCESGIRTFNQHKTIDVNAVAVLKRLSHLPVLVDTSTILEVNNARPLSKSAIAAGADGVILPTLKFTSSHREENEFAELSYWIKELLKVADAVRETDS